jgi:hypothetical protein
MDGRIGKESLQFDISEWSQHLYSPEVINGIEKYYFVHTAKHN